MPPHSGSQMRTQEQPFMQGAAQAFSRVSDQTHGICALPAGWLDDSRQSFVLTGMAWVLIVLMIVPDNFDYSGLSGAAGPVSGGAVSRLLWSLLFGAGLFVTAWRGKLAYLVLRGLNPFLLAFAALAFASCLWSIEPAVTARRLIRVFTIILDSLALVLMGWRPLRFQGVLRPILTAMLVGSLLFGLAFPHLAIHQESSAELVGAWRGLTAHKNSLGALSCVTLILWVHAWLTRQTRLTPALFGTTIAVTCLVLSRSSTSLVASAFSIAFLFIFLRMPSGLRRQAPYIVGLFVSLLLIYSLAILRLLPGLDLILAPIVAVTGKDSSFTGRSDIWKIVIDHIHLHRLLGTGYGAYWTGPVEGTPSFDFIRLMRFYPGSAHNGYLEIMNDLGFAGLICLIGYMVAYVRQALSLFAVDRNQGTLYLCLFVQQGITNLSESHWLSVMSVAFVIMTMATSGIAREILEVRLRHYFGMAQQAVDVQASHFEPPGNAATPGSDHGSPA